MKVGQAEHADTAIATPAYNTGLKEKKKQEEKRKLVSYQVKKQSHENGRCAWYVGEEASRLYNMEWTPYK